MIKEKVFKNFESSFSLIFALYFLVFFTICSIFFSFLSPIKTFAANSTFTVTQRIDNYESEPPSIPQNVLLEVLSSSGIRISWDASTDNRAVAFYNIYRDGILFASTTLTTYDDEGLMPLTGYTYKINAVDPSANVSGFSDEVSATTSAPYVPPPVTPSGRSSGTIMNIVSDLSISESYYSATVIWKTSLPSRYVLRYGYDDSYELGSIKSEYLSKIHRVFIPDLLPGKDYVFNIELTDSYGRVTKTLPLNFSTSRINKDYFKTNVSNFTLSLGAQIYVVNGGNKEETGEKVLQSEVNLKWKIPENSDIDTVKILRSDKHYPVDIIDGKLVYEGKGENFLDRVTGEGKYFYTIFAKNLAGNYSSGAVNNIQISDPNSKKDTPVVDKYFPDNIEKFDISNLNVVQDGVKIFIINLFDSKTPLFTVKSDINTEFFILTKNIKNGVENILIEFQNNIENKEKSTYTFALGDDKIKYELAVIFSEAGTYKFTIYLFDKKWNLLQKNDGLFSVKSDKISTSFKEWGDEADVMSLPDYFAVIILVIIGIIIIIRSFRRK